MVIHGVNQNMFRKNMSFAEKVGVFCGTPFLRRRNLEMMLGRLAASALLFGQAYPMLRNCFEIFESMDKSIYLKHLKDLKTFYDKSLCLSVDKVSQIIR